MRLESSSLKSGRYAFVLPRFAENVAGGASMLAGSLAAALAERGDHVEVWTTCARDNRTWANDLPEGEAEVRGITTRRFRVDERNLEEWIPKQIAICDGMSLSIEDQLLWMQESVNSFGLYEHILRNARQFDAVFYAPYLFGSTFWGSQICPENAVLIPCLHDEQYAYTDVIGAMFRATKGCLFNAQPEAELARSLYGSIAGGEVGMGFEPFAKEYLNSLTRLPSLSRPYLLYAGRKETGKNAHVMVNYFCHLKDEGLLPEELTLVLIGGGSFSDLHCPEAEQRDDVLDLGFVTEQEKHSAMRHSLALCQPSTNESFSIVMMEAWLVGAPCLVHAHCSVTRHHAVRSGGGLYFADEGDFYGAIQALLSDGGLRSDMVCSGERYVRERYSWSAVLERFDNVLRSIFSVVQGNDDLEASPQNQS